jgi:predicted transcriptional regulator
MKSDRQLEKIVRGYANHKRIAILRFLADDPGASVVTIAHSVRSNYQTTADHVRRLHRSGLIHKRQPGPAQRHELTARGRSVLDFLGQMP